MSGALTVCILTNITNMKYAAVHAVSKSDRNAIMILKIAANGPN
jgi:hypothetical protein